MPASQVDVAHVKDISVFIGQKLRAEIMELNRREGNVLLSRRRLLEKEIAANREEVWAELAEGQIRRGIVGNLTDFGAFVNLGGIDGLIHISDLSYSQVDKVSDVVKAGQEVEVKVLKVDRPRERISLGLKQVQPDPWSQVGEKYPAGSRTKVRVVRLEKFGAFVELEEGVEGLIPLSEMSWGRINKPGEMVEVGQMIEAEVIRVEPHKRRLALSLKQVAADPWANVEQSFPKNALISGTVTKCAEFGAFVELLPGVEGLIHISELAEEHVRKSQDVVQPGQEVQVRVLGVDLQQRRISLSIKAALAEPTEEEQQPSEAEKEASKQKKRKKPLRGGLTSFFEWQGQSLDINRRDK